jgi:hypothetical protein
METGKFCDDWPVLFQSCFTNRVRC